MTDQPSALKQAWRWFAALASSILLTWGLFSAASQAFEGLSAYGWPSAEARAVRLEVETTISYASDDTSRMHPQKSHRLRWEGAFRAAGSSREFSVTRFDAGPAELMLPGAAFAQKTALAQARPLMVRHHPRDPARALYRAGLSPGTAFFFQPLVLLAYIVFRAWLRALGLRVESFTPRAQAAAKVFGAWTIGMGLGILATLLAVSLQTSWLGTLPSGEIIAALQMVLLIYTVKRFG